MNPDISQIKHLIAERRSVKPVQYSGERIDDHLVEMVLEAANWAPTHGYTEPWRFVVFTEDALSSLGKFMADLDQPDNSIEGFNQQRYDRLFKRPQMSSHVIGIGMKPGNNPKVPEIEEICSTAMAVQNMWLMAHSLGLGAYWSTGALAFRDETRNFFGLDPDCKSLGFFYMGIPAGKVPAGRRISEIEAKTTWRR